LIPSSVPISAGKHSRSTPGAQKIIGKKFAAIRRVMKLKDISTPSKSEVSVFPVGFSSTLLFPAWGLGVCYLVTRETYLKLKAKRITFLSPPLTFLGIQAVTPCIPSCTLQLLATSCSNTNRKIFVPLGFRLQLQEMCIVLSDSICRRAPSELKPKIFK